ncbi:MAG TPA: endonuclease/exonuclease/phosphatase family protein [Gemmatimonadaceae bacterium]|nr:endonuclease/exonuclease/phosphatase family protein [Gemmatimonadaceae bacterium]
MRARTHADTPNGNRLRTAAMLVAVLLLLEAGLAHAQAPVRVMSFNIRYGTAPDGHHVWPNRRAHVIATLRDHAPHLLGVQEALRSQMDEIAPALPHHRELGVGREDGKTAGEYSALLVDTVRFTVLDHGTFWFSDTPDTPGSTSWGNRITRISTWARLADRATEDTVRVYNLHWDHESQPSRERSAALLAARIAADGSPGDRLLVLGDFNADEQNPAYRALLGDPRTPLRDAFRAVYPDARMAGTFNAFRGDSTGGMIDHVLVGTRWRVVDAGIDRRRFGALWASDHFAVWAVLRRE